MKLLRSLAAGVILLVASIALAGSIVTGHQLQDIDGAMPVSNGNADDDDIPRRSTQRRRLEEPMEWTEIDFNDFEDGQWGSWTDGGSDATLRRCPRISGQRINCAVGERAVRIRDNSGAESSMTSIPHAVSAYDEVRVSFYFYARSMEEGEDFWLLYRKDIGDWVKHKEWRRGTEFDNDIRYPNNEVTINVADATSIAIRFQCDASGNNDQIFIDDVKVEGRALSTSNGSSEQPSALPSNVPSLAPSTPPSPSTNIPSGKPTGAPTFVHSVDPSSRPSSEPSSIPSRKPTGAPSAKPSSTPQTPPSPPPPPPPPGSTCGDGTCVKECSNECLLDPLFDLSCCGPANANSCPSFEGCADVSPPTTASPQTSEPSRVPSVIPSALPSPQPSDLPSALPSSSPVPDPCEPNPCNGGSCVVTGVGTEFECNCATVNREGPRCEEPRQTYGYTGSGCSLRSTALPNSVNVVIEFWATGDFPYDEESTSCTTGTCSKCGTSNDSGSRPENDDTCRWPRDGPEFTNFQCTEGCTYEGREYACWRDLLIPWMNGESIPNYAQVPENANVPFAIHVGDFLKGRGSGNTGRCNPDSFESRLDLFNDLLSGNFLMVPGDNDWQECNGYGTGAIETMWRDVFADTSSLFNQFNANFDFPDYPNSQFPIFSHNYGKRPSIERQINQTGVDDYFPENLFFLHNDVAFFGLNRPAGWDDARDACERWVRHSLEEMRVPSHNSFLHQQDTCIAVKSVVVWTHVGYFSQVEDAIEDYFSTVCQKTVPILNIRGNTHDYCFESNSGSTKLELTVGGDASQEMSDPHLVSILSDPEDPTSHYFHIERNDGVSDPANCEGFN